VFWSEAFSREQPSQVLLLAAQNGSTAQGIVASVDTLSTLTLITDNTSVADKAALTNCGLIRVTGLAPTMTLQLTVAHASASAAPNYNIVPPLLQAEENFQILHPCDIPLYDGTGPFVPVPGDEPVNYNTASVGVGYFTPSADCVNIAYNGTVTVYIEHTGSPHTAWQFHAPSPTSSSTATDLPAWGASSQSIATATGTNHPYAVFRCNSGTTVMVTQNTSTGVLSLKYVHAAFNPPPTDDLVGDPILESQYGTGIVFAYGGDQLLWFCNAYEGVNKNSLYRYINTSTGPSGSYTNSQATGFTGELLVYAGTNGPNLYVATSDGTYVYLYSFDVTPGWSSATQIITTSGGIVDLLADIIVGDSALIVAVLSSSVVCYTHSLV
jgi:hypothetical protein